MANYLLSLSKNSILSLFLGCSIMSAVNVKLTLPEGVTNYRHDINSSEETLPALRQAVKNCQTQLNQILTDVVEAERAKAKTTATGGDAKKMTEKDENEDDDEEEDEDEDDDEDENDVVASNGN